MLNAKYNPRIMKTSDMAKALGRLGGLARAKKLLPERKRKIAASGGKARARSLLMAQRIMTNLRYAEAMRKLRGKPDKVTRLKNFNGPLPGIYA